MTLFWTPRCAEKLSQPDHDGESVLFYPHIRSEICYSSWWSLLVLSSLCGCWNHGNTSRSWDSSLLEYEGSTNLPPGLKSLLLFRRIETWCKGSDRIGMRQRLSGLSKLSSQRLWSRKRCCLSRIEIRV